MHVNGGYMTQEKFDALIRAVGLVIMIVMMVTL